MLRKALYPEFLVRGEYRFRDCRVDIAVFKTTYDHSKPELKLIIEVKRTERDKSTEQQHRYQELLGVPCIYIKGATEAYKVVETVLKMLRGSPQGQRSDAAILDPRRDPWKPLETI